MTRRLLSVILAGLCLMGLAAAVPTPAVALPLVAAPRVLVLGDSLTWQGCTGQLQRFGSDAPRWLRDRDGGCYGFGGATVSDMAFMVQGGRFRSADAGQPHPYFGERGMADVWNVREAINRAGVLVIGLGTNDANRRTSCGTRTTTFWPVQINNARGSGPNPPPCQLTDKQVRDHIDYFVWLAQGKPVFWFDVAVTAPADPAHAHQEAINAQIWAAAGRHANFHPIAWQRAVSANPGHLRDGVHLSDAGRAARHRLLLTALQGCGIR